MRIFFGQCPFFNVICKHLINIERNCLEHNPSNEHHSLGIIDLVATLKKPASANNKRKIFATLYLSLAINV